MLCDLWGFLGDLLGDFYVNPTGLCLTLGILVKLDGDFQVMLSKLDISQLYISTIYIYISLQGVAPYLAELA